MQLHGRTRVSKTLSSLSTVLVVVIGYITGWISGGMYMYPHEPVAQPAKAKAARVPEVNSTMLCGSTLLFAVSATALYTMGIGTYLGEKGTLRLRIRSLVALNDGAAV